MAARLKRPSLPGRGAMPGKGRGSCRRRPRAHDKRRWRVPESTSDLIARINRLTTPGHRGNLVARGLARGLVWRDGALPPEAPSFSPDLTTDLLDHGFQLLSTALSLRAAGGDADVVRRGLYAAAE